MMAPHYERARMLCAAVQRATEELAEPIDRIEVASGKVTVWAGKKRLSMRYYYANSYNNDGAPLLGGGQWIVELIGADNRGEQDERSSTQTMLARLQNLFTRKD